MDGWCNMICVLGKVLCMFFLLVVSRSELVEVVCFMYKVVIGGCIYCMVLYMVRLFEMIFFGELMYMLMGFLGFLVFRNRSWVIIKFVMLFLIGFIMKMMCFFKSFEKILYVCFL